MDLQQEKDDKKNQNQKTRVKVAIRVRPMIPREKVEGESSCLEYKSNNEIIIGGDRSYKFDRVFKDDSHQSQIFQHCIKELVENCFEGYNAAVLAYGQTGSGKTYTMGTALSSLNQGENIGIIPRVIEEVFQQVQNRKKKAEFIIKASFLEIYNEQIIDLLADQHLKNIKNKQNAITIREQKDGSVSIYGVNQEKVSSNEQMFRLLEKGGFNRTTASTLMNDASSRSHAIFTIFIEQHIIEDLYKSESNKDIVEEGFMSAKFFFVDLAGSERAKKTGATGATLKEGININLGLLELGNVISALATIQKKQDQFITFRNSKLTRILQDCLGGNSNTYMIACVSPAQSNFEQSLNTLKYASKAMNIKNTPVINRDPQSALISQLRQKIFQLEGENRKLKMMLNQKGVTFDEEIGNSDELSEELKKVKDEQKAYLKKYELITQELSNQKHKNNGMEIKLYELRRQKDIMQIKFQEIIKQHPQLQNLQFSQQLRDHFDENEKSKLSTLEDYLQQIQQLEMKLVDKDSIFHQLQIQYEKLVENSKKDEKILIKKNNVLYNLGKQNIMLKKQLQNLKNKQIIDNNDINTSKSMSITQFNNSISYEEDYNEIQILQNTEIIEKDDFIIEHESNYTVQELKTKDEISQMDKYILEKEQFLEKMSRQQINLETQLINEMKNQYHQKIAMLEKERKNLMTRQKDQSNSFEKNKFVNKIENLENELKDYRKKAKDQKNMEKLLQNQNYKIKDLAEEIKKFKMQKIQLFRKLKQDKDNFDKLKNKRIKQLLYAKKQNLKKDSQIRKLTLQNIKKTQTNKKKEEEIKRTKKINQTLKSLLKPPPTKRDNIRESTQSTNNQMGNQKIQYDLQQLQKQQEELLMRSIKQILEQIDRQHLLKKYQSKLYESEKQLHHLLIEDSTIKLKLERIKLKDDDEITEEQQVKRDEFQLHINDLRERISICDDSIAFCRNKHSILINQHVQYFNIDTAVIYNKLYENNDVLKILVKSIFNVLKNLLFENYMIVSQRQQKQNDIKSLNQQVIQLRQQLISISTEYHQNLAQLREEMMMVRYNQMEEQEAPSTSSYKRIEEKDKKQLQRKILELTKHNRQLTQQLQKMRRKSQVVQQKYQNLKNLVSKDKNIGRPDELLASKTDRKVSITEKQMNNKAMIDELEGMMDNIDRLKKAKSSAMLEEYHDKQEKKEDAGDYDYNSNRWECTGKIEGAHTSSILSIAACSNQLISTATKSVKIWDIQTRTQLSQITSSSVSGIVKFVAIDPIRPLFFTACDKTVSIWESSTLELKGTLKAHKDEVRAIHISGNYLFTGGKGTNNGGSLLVWDFRKLNFNQAMQEKQKNQDIFSFTSHENILYYGTRNHSIRRMNINNLEILSPFEPPHMDSVTGLAIVKNNLISGSKDKNLRLWSLDHAVNNSKNTLHAFNDYITSVEHSPCHSLFYSGSKDGQVKVCTTKNNKIEVLGGILCHTQSVNSICPLQEAEYRLATASQDKSIKIWQPTKQTKSAIGLALSAQNGF